MATWKKVIVSGSNAELLTVTSSFLGNLTGTASYATNANSSSYALNSTSASYALNATSASYALNATSASYALTSTSASYALSASNATTASYVLNAVSSSFASTASFVNTLNQDVVISGSLSVTNGITGSLLGTASYAANANSSSYALSASYAFNSTSASYAFNSTSASYALSASNAATASYVSASAIDGLNLSRIVAGTVTASVDTGVNSFTLTSGSSTLFTVSNAGVISGSTLIINTITASNSLVTNTLTAENITATSASFGYVQTITGSAVIIGQEYIILNTQIPAARYAGLQIYDSGSNATASIVWDSETNHFVYENVSGSTYSGGGFLSGPKNTGSLADITYPTQYRVLRSQGDDHVYNSNIIDNDTKVAISINTEVTGTLNVTAGITGSLFGTASWANNATTASYVLNAVSSSFASTASSVDTLNQNVIISGSLTVFTGSAVELQVLNTGVKIGNIIGDAHSITGSLGISGSVIITGSSFSIVSTAGATNTEFQVLSTGTRIGNATGDTHNVTGSLRISGSNTIRALTNTAIPFQINSPANTSIVRINGIGGVEIGADSSASGTGSFAQGEAFTTALGDYSHAQGNSTSAVGIGSHAEGASTISTGDFSHAEGTSTEAIGTWSHAEGYGTRTIGDFSHAEGEGTIASGSAQTVMGKYNAQGNTTSLVIIGNGVDDGTRSDLALFNTNQIVFNAPLSGSSFTGSLFGTASYASNANSASYALNATSASYALNATSASYAASVNNLTNAITNNTDNRIITATGGGTINGESNLTFDGTTLTVTGNAVITSNLTVQGTASFQNTTNLEVADRFVLLASGSNTAGDGGVIVQQGTQNVGELFGFDSGTTRWAFTSSFNGANSTFTPDAFVAAAVIGANAVPTSAPARYQVAGNIFIGTDENIWIYS
jgi:hypothetical protein